MSDGVGLLEVGVDLCWGGVGVVSVDDGGGSGVAGGVR